MPATDICQTAVTKITEQLSAFAESLSSTNETIRLSLTTANELAQLAAKVSNKGQVAVTLDGSSKDAVQLSDTVKAWQKLLGVNRRWHVISGEMTEQEIAGDVVSDLSKTIHHLLIGSPDGFVLPSTVLTYPVPSQAEYEKLGATITVGEQFSQREAITKLVDIGYTRYDKTVESGGFVVRGEQLLLRHPVDPHVAILTWRGNIIEAITKQEASRTSKQAHHTVYPARFPTEQTTLPEVLRSATVLRPLHADVNGATTIIHDALQPDMQFPLPAQDLSKLTSDSVYVWYENRDRVEQYVSDHKLSATLCSNPVAAHPFAFKLDDSIHVSEAMLLPETSDGPRPVSYAKGMELLAELTVSRPAVHSDHGIGIYEGLRSRKIGTHSREYLVLRYAAGDMLSVPVEYAHKVTPYIGEGSPPIGRLGGTGWLKSRAQAQADAEAFAKELLTTARKRDVSDGHAYDLSSTLDDEMDASFPFTLTPDQDRAWQDVREDLASDRVMDRLIVGDVGFGKTEVAFRAARHAIDNGKQVAILAPTTLLVQQHSNTWRERFPDLANVTTTVSRFATPRQLAASRDAIKSGDVTVAIGTHALLSDSTAWKNLGLVIIDEEQRFGVKQKEHFKQIRAAVDILSLSATPIPRTLSMSLSGIKQLSIISTAPVGRQQVTTHVGRDNDEVLTTALSNELARSGQAYVVAPKVRHLPSLQLRINELLPKARTAVAHGQLPPKQLAGIMEQFNAGEFDVLISSTIIESGIDLPNANTIIVIQATHFGLADLYQLRGRVGRRKRQGHAYFLYNQSELTSDQRQRLAALTEATRLGSGWSLAQRDLEIRGAGNLLGAEQSGTINAVGAQLYLDLVREAVAQSQTPVRRHDVDIQLPLVAGIPEHYIADTAERTTLYQHLARATAVDDITLLLEAITERYGPAPMELQNLVLLLHLQHAAAAAGIAKIDHQTISPPDEDPYERLHVTAQNIPRLLQSLAALGNWEVKDDVLQLNLATIDRDLVKRLLAVLE